MPTLVHIADAKLSSKIANAGILPGKATRVVFFMPVVQDHLVSHQWLRELRRSGVRTFVGVYFRLPSEELVWAGRYNEPHRELPLGDAIGQLMALPDPLGFELFLQRKIVPKEITRIRRLPQNVGWRYMPHAHGRALCGCPACIPKGSIKSRELRARLDPTPSLPPYESLKRVLSTSQDVDEILDALWPLRRKQRRADPKFMEPLLSLDNVSVLEEVALTLGYFRHQNATRLLSKLIESKYPEVREAAALSIRQLSGGLAK